MIQSVTDRLVAVGILVLAGVVCVACQDGTAAADEPAAESTTESQGDMAVAGLDPDSLRNEVARLLRRTGRPLDDGPLAAVLDSARSLAAAYELRWQDSILIRRIALFEAAPIGRRRNMALADSFYRAGRDALDRDGPSAAIARWRESLRLAGAADDQLTRAVAISALGGGFYLVGWLDSATAYLSEARRLARAAGDVRTEGNAVGMLANVVKDEGDPGRALELYRTASDLRARSGDTRGLAADQNNLGLIAWQMGDLEEARRAFEGALAANRESSRRAPAARNLANLGGLASLAGDFARADSLYREAIAIDVADGNEAELAFVLHDLGKLATRRGNYREAIEVLSHAIEIHDRTGSAAASAAVRSDLAAVRAAAGELQSAADALEQADRDAKSAGANRSVRADIALARGDVFVRLGRLADADAAYRRSADVYGATGNVRGRAEAQTGLGGIALSREDYGEALRIFEMARRELAASGDSRAAARAAVLAGSARQAAGDTAGARQELELALAELQFLGDPAGSAAAMEVLGDLAADASLALAAEAWYAEGLRALEGRGLPEQRWRLYAGLGRSLRTRGSFVQAAEQLQAAVREIESTSETLRGPNRSGFLADKWQVFAELAEVDLILGRVDAAFAVSERMRGRQMLATLAGGRIESHRSGIGREQDLRRRVNELVAEIASVEAPATLRELRVDGARTEETVGVSREALGAIQREYADVLAGLQSEAPAYARLVEAEPVSWQVVSRRLARDEVLIEYLLDDPASSVLVVTRDTVAALELPASGTELARLVDFARFALSDRDSIAASLPWTTPMARLYELLIKPVRDAGYFDGIGSVVVVPHGPLNFLPFGALASEDDGVSGEVHVLAEAVDITYAPSASAWVRLSDKEPGNPRRVLALAPRTDRLSGSRDEVAAIREVFGRRATALTGDEASEVALRTSGEFDVLHLATFGVLNKHNPLFSYVELAPGGSDGRLEVHEIFGLDLAGHLVVLSACQTALASGAFSDVPAGEDWIGLVQAFLQAGAGGVLASLWPVEDQSTARLMRLVYERLETGQGSSAALAAAQRVMMTDPATAHPFYWAGFIYTGGNSR